MSEVCKWRRSWPHVVSPLQWWGYMLPVFLLFSPPLQWVEDGRGPGLRPNWPDAHHSIFQRVSQVWSAVVEIKRSAAEITPFSHPPATLVALWYHLTLPGHQPPIPVSFSSLLMQMAELILTLYNCAVSFSSPLPQWMKFPYPKPSVAAVA